MRCGGRIASTEKENKIKKKKKLKDQNDGKEKAVQWGSMREEERERVLSLFWAL